jgi:chromate reductase, NAD(P)H dehydrogenase (quinone)
VTTRILAISGSLRRESHNSLLLRLAQERAPDHIEIVIWDGLADVPAYNEDNEVDPGAAVLGLRTALVDADALLIATPEYNFGVPGALKNALDWASRPYGGSALSGVPTSVIGASPSSFAAAQSRGDLRRALALSGASVDDETVGFVSERLTTERDAVIAEVSDVVRALAERVGVPV